MRSGITISVLLGVCCALVAALIDHTHIVGGARPVDGLEAFLNQHIGGFDCDEVPLEEAIHRLEKQAHCRINVIWQKVEAAGVSRERPITIALQDANVSTVLNTILLQAQGSWRNDLTYRWIDHVLTVSTRDDVSRELIVRVYDVHELVPLIAKAEREWSGPLPTEDESGGGAIFGGGGGIFGSFVPVYRNSFPANSGSREFDWAIEDLQTLIENWIDPKNWDDKSSGTSSIRAWQGCFIVVAPREAQSRIASLLTEFPVAGIYGGTTRPTMDLWQELGHQRRFPIEEPDILPGDRIAEVSWDDVSLGQAVEILVEKSKLKIAFDPKSFVLGKSDIMEREVKLHLKDVTVSQALDILLEYFSSDYSRLGWSYQDHIVWIGDAGNDDPPKQYGTSLYDVRDICGSDSDRWQALQAAIAEASSHDSEGIPRVEVFNGRLIINTTPRNHRRIETLLRELRAGRTHLTTQPVDVDGGGGEVPDFTQVPNRD